MNLPLYIARRYLIAKKSHNAINIISWISVIGISIGTFALVVVLSAFNGLEGLVESLFENFDSDIRITAKSGRVFTSDQLNINKISETEGVANYTQVLEEVCALRYQSQEAVATIKGVEASFLEMSKLDEALIDGELILQRNSIPFAISGYGIASQLGLYLSKSPDNITIYAPKREKFSSLNPMNAVYKKMIASGGVFYISPEYDNKYVVVPLDFARNLLDYKNGEISSLEIKINENANIQAVADRIKAILPNEKFQLKSRYEFNELLYKTNKTEKWVTFLILLFILILASFNILSSLSMLIIEKKKDIYSLKSMGAGNQLIRKIFFFEGLMINFSGALSGMILGILLCWLQQTFGLVKLEGGIVEYYPVVLKPLELILIFFTVLLIGFLSSWYPVWKLTKSEKTH